MKIKNILKHPFFAGSLMMIVGGNLYNGGQFIYHFLAGRLLGKVYYGDLAVIISILGFVAIIQSSLGLTIIKFLTAQKDDESKANFIKWVYWWSIWIGVVVLVLFLILAPVLSKFLNINQPTAFYLLGPLLLFFLLAANGRFILQGLLKFDRYVLSLLTESVVKILLMIPLIIAGYAVFGAMTAFFIGVIFSFVVVKLSLSRYLSGTKGKRPKIAPLLKYSLATFAQGLALTSMYSTDLILVKHFFPAGQAGIYASLAILGRVVFFGASPITQVMFPLVAKRHSENGSYHKILYLSLLLIGSFSTVVTLFYFLFPKIPLGILYGAEYLEGMKLLWWFGIFMSLLAFAMLLTQYYLSIGKTKVPILFLLAAFLQIILIWFIHPTLLTVIQISILSTALLVLSLFIYFIYHTFGKGR